MEWSGQTLTAFHRASWLGGSGTRGAAQEHLLAFPAGLHQATFARLRASVNMWSWNVRRLDVSLLPRCFGFPSRMPYCRLCLRQKGLFSACQ